MTQNLDTQVQETAYIKAGMPAAGIHIGGVVLHAIASLFAWWNQYSPAWLTVKKNVQPRYSNFIIADVCFGWLCYTYMRRR
jgi:hypothetical protein